jgi:hypothetical protein
MSDADCSPPLPSIVATTRPGRPSPRVRRAGVARAAAGAVGVPTRARPGFVGLQPGRERLGRLLRRMRPVRSAVEQGVLRSKRRSRGWGVLRLGQYPLRLRRRVG